ncbi:MAG: TlpA family protein disulfide reductase [Planctomycetaceae bacterium]|nr:TlpA family protein disulfide reductase [Planctomycetaceae bacterium]
MIQKSCLALILCVSFAVSATAQTKSLAEAESFSDVATYIQQEDAKLVAQGLDRKEYTIAIGELLLAASDRLLEVAQNDMEIRTAYNFKITAYRRQIDADVEGANEKFDALLKEWAESDDLNAQRMAQLHRFTQFSNTARRAEVSPESFANFKTDLKGWLERKETSLANIVTLGLAVAQRNGVSDQQFIAELVEYVQSPQFSATDGERANLILSLEGILRLAIGNDPKLYGRTLDDEEFEWESLRKEGKEKYVLVNFTATWCGPCQMELPGLLEAYKKYEDKGLEIVSIYVWQREADPIATVKNYVEEKGIPWIIISEELSKRAGHPDYREFYNLSGVPTMVLADREGKIIAEGMQARGASLQAKLAEIFE